MRKKSRRRFGRKSARRIGFVFLKFLHGWARKIYMVFAARAQQDPPVFAQARLLFSKLELVRSLRKSLLHGTAVAVYIAGQERRLVDPPSQVVAGVRTVTTNMDGRDALPRMSRPFALSGSPQKQPQIAHKAHAAAGNFTKTRSSQK